MFERALQAMQDEASQVYGPLSFVTYATELGRVARTAESISKDSLGTLPPCLRAASTMVFRLGCPLGQRNTHFALARCVDGWADYFLLDDELFRDIRPELFIPDVSLRRLYAYTLLPAVTETSLVNLAIASGLLNRALGVDDTEVPSAPATGQSVFSFPVTPHERLGVTWQHINGQVEIDALMVARRAGREVLFLIEAKKSNAYASLAKHKLVYPALAVRGGLPSHTPVVPVYLRIIAYPDGLHFHVAECAEASPAMPVSSLNVVKASRWVLTGFGGQPIGLR
jgi:hypothetical protein